MAPILCEVCVLAGGMSSRMGRNKARLRLGGRTLLSHLRDLADRLDMPVRIIQRDLVPRCGPLGGVYSALVTTRAPLVLFLACDMPFVPIRLLRRMLRRFKASRVALFLAHEGVVGFPFVLRRNALPGVEALLAEGTRSLQTVAEKLQAQLIAPLGIEVAGLLNVNTRAEWALAREHWHAQRRGPATRGKTVRGRKQG